MIAFLAGTVAARTQGGCVVLTSGGVGYEVGMTLAAAASLPKVGGEVELFVQTIVREDAIELYGFTTWDERMLFATLLSINKLGPKTALAILAVFTPDDLRRLVLTDDYTRLIQVPGIGKKSAQRIFLDLKFKLEGQGASGPAPSLPSLDGSAVNAFRDALAGLTNLGYDEGESRKVLEEVFTDQADLDVGSALREALKRIAKRRA
ncbi:Holliday junction branch migration protein RuvA [Desulfovibrio ferrophilus]|uniref:Holliday junction branch migration complex subunit RuvA n=1 Tax=Desulfovibrio ferrophilus TaxID=241368 RepID=A0A2Z6AUP5_9BACT|nr:Holliday junction branch migration protein RuvA [Desulfovibrio ferrophilus]BBD06962.1 Holliday junction ATP-dependent DNA helicase RuvA [Desulfovibrio ferrophilus]